MPYCTKCRTEYREGITKCADCGRELMSDDAAAPDRRVSPIPAWSRAPLHLALLLSGLLPNRICVIGLAVVAFLVFRSRPLHSVGIGLACLWVAAMVSREVVIHIGRRFGRGCQEGSAVSPPQGKCITEMKAAALFCNTMLSSVDKAWPGIRKQLLPRLGKGFSFENESDAQYEFALAGIAIQLQALPNLLPPDQAQRVRALVDGCLMLPADTGHPETYALDVVRVYEGAWDRSDEIMADPSGTEPPNMPHDDVAGELLNRWRCTAVTQIGGVRYRPPRLVMELGAILIGAGGWWKWLLSEYRLMPG